MSNHDPWGQPYDPRDYEADYRPGGDPSPPPRRRPDPSRTYASPGHGPPSYPSPPPSPPPSPTPPPSRTMPQAGSSPYATSPNLNVPTVEFATLSDPALVRLSPEDTGERPLQPVTGPPAAVDTLERTAPSPEHGDAWAVPDNEENEPKPIPRQNAGPKPGQKGSRERPIGAASRKQLGPDWTASPLRFSLLAVVTLAVLAGSAAGIVALGMWINP